MSAGRAAAPEQGRAFSHFLLMPKESVKEKHRLTAGGFGLANLARYARLDLRPYEVPLRGEELNVQFFDSLLLFFLRMPVPSLVEARRSRLSQLSEKNMKSSRSDVILKRHLPPMIFSCQIRSL